MHDVLDEIREELSRIVRKEPTNGHLGQHSVLKEMALDPTSEAWGERLQIVRGAGSDVESDQSANAPGEPSAEPGKLF